MAKLVVLILIAISSFSQPREQISIGYKIKLQSEVLGEEKEIYISLPHKYEEHIQSYPVVFTLEAEFLFESVSNISKMMSARSKMPQSIVVGLANGQFKKRHELGYKKWNGIPDKYIEFFQKELIRYIEKHYRVNSHRTIIGLSPTTGFVLEAMLDEPDIFKSYILLSAHFEWPRKQGASLIDEVLAKTSEKDYPNVSIYFGRAENDLKEKEYFKDAFNDAKEKLKHANNVKAKIKIDMIEDGEHYLMVLEGIRRGFQLEYPNNVWRDPGIYGWDKSYNYAVHYYKSYYDNLSNRYGFDIYPVEDGHSYGFSFSGFIYNASRWGSSEQQKGLLELGLTYYPNSAMIHKMYSEYYKREGNTSKAIQYAEKAIDIAQRYKDKDVLLYKKYYLELNETH